MATTGAIASALVTVMATGSLVLLLASVDVAVMTLLPIATGTPVAVHVPSGFRAMFSPQ